MQHEPEPVTSTFFVGLEHYLQFVPLHFHFEPEGRPVLTVKLSLSNLEEIGFQDFKIIAGEVNIRVFWNLEIKYT